VAGALGSGRRAEIVDLLGQGERSVADIADQIGQSVGKTSHHLHILARAGPTHPFATPGSSHQRRGELP
jgi:DNA-binding transcriptional ArsR family regulator